MHLLSRHFNFHTFNFLLMKSKALFFMLAAAASLSLTSCLEMNGDDGSAHPKGSCQGKQTTTTTTTTNTNTSSPTGSI